MSRSFVLLFAVSHINALKLLASPEDTEWESDIQFSFTPYEGTCQDGGGNIDATASGDNGYDANKVLTNLECDAAVAGATDFKKYCDIEADNKQFKTIAAKWKADLVTAKQFKKCPYIYAKLATMNNAELKKENKVKPVKSFDVKMDDCAVVFYTEDATKGKTAKDVYCYSTAGITWAKNDPIVKNMDGEQFEILSTGTFMLLSLQEKEFEKTNLEVLSTIDRAGTRCGATYIQNITLQGAWVEEEGIPQIQVRAAPAVPKSQALEVNFDGSWQPANSRWSYKSVETASRTQFTLNLKGMKTLVSVDSHRIHEEGVKTKRFANFLNVHFEGIFNFPGMTVRGLLGRDSHADAAQLPTECTSSALLISKDSKMLSSSIIA